MPAVARYIAAILALELLTGPEGRVTVRVPYTKNVLWSNGVVFYGLILPCLWINS